MRLGVTGNEVRSDLGMRVTWESGNEAASDLGMRLGVTGRP